MNKFEKALLARCQMDGIGTTINALKLVITNNFRDGADLTTPHNRNLLRLGRVLGDAARLAESKLKKEVI